MKNPFRKRWIAVIIGNESGTVYPIDFILFRDKTKGDRWVQEMNGRKGRRAINELTHYELRER